MTFPDNRLEELLAAAKAGRVANSELLVGIRDSILYVPTADRNESAGSVALPCVAIDGAQYVPAYSSAEQLRLATGDVSWVKLPVVQLVDRIPTGVGIALNWRAPAPGLPITAAGIGILRGDSGTVTAGSNVRFGQPAHRPDAFLDHLIREFATIGEIRSARFGLMQVDDAAPTFILGIELLDQDPSIKDKTANRIQQIASRSQLDFGVETFFIEPHADSEFTRQVLALPAIYQAR
ncbi:enhanced serine sensitivity protein SseB C-terminal domain-containing protein [Nocardia sp. NPDC127526]|uniref:enhanced serine sensitivity protein SseB C-terminal domain-containing protein n=1 Tax=Nocardia sp. NPDC127526 TaxID=3345393 RepID=UPI00363079B5